MIIRTLVTLQAIIYACDNIFYFEDCYLTQIFVTIFGKSTKIRTQENRHSTFGMAITGNQGCCLLVSNSRKKIDYFDILSTCQCRIYKPIFQLQSEKKDTTHIPGIVFFFFFHSYTEDMHSIANCRCMSFVLFFCFCCHFIKS